MLEFRISEEKRAKLAKRGAVFLRIENIPSRKILKLGTLIFLADSVTFLSPEEGEERVDLARTGASFSLQLLGVP